MSEPRGARLAILCALRASAAATAVSVQLAATNFPAPQAAPPPAPEPVHERAPHA